jgi:drug/metabolite transporter (DMT)-like permease
MVTKEKYYGFLKNQEYRGWLYGFMGMLGFSLTLPATRLAVIHIDPELLGFGRAIAAAFPAALLLWVRGASWPTWQQWRALSLVTLGVVFGFPLLTAYGMHDLPAAHGAIVIALLPLATTVAARGRAQERPSRGFWVTAMLGSGLVLGFAVFQGAGHLQGGDLALLGAITLAALGYAEGGRLARDMGGWQVISWALVLGAPFALVPAIILSTNHPVDIPLSAWLGFAYVTLISQLLAFFAWYQGLALVGVAKVSQLQLFMPFFALLGAHVILQESIPGHFLAFAVAIIVMVAINRRMPVARSTA